MNFKIREGIISDYLEVSRLTKEVHDLHLKHRPDVYLDVDNPMLEEYFLETLNSSDIKLFVVQNEATKELAGFTIIQKMALKNPIVITNTFIHIDSFCVSSKYKRNGIGTLLFNHVLSYSKAEKITSLQLTVWEFNKDAVKFYEKMGMSTRNHKMEINLS